MTESDAGRVAAEAVRASRTDLPAWTGTFELLSDPTRLKILIAIHAAPGSSVTEIAAATGVTANTVSQSLAALSGAHVVAVQRDGRFRRWSLSDEAAHQVLHHMKAPHSVLHPEH